MFGAKQGSGYLLSARLVLTAGHVVGDRPVATVVVPGGRGRVSCDPVWVGGPDECDAALLLADDDLVAPEVAGTFEPNRFGRVDDLSSLLDCQSIGFPDAQRYDSGRLDTEQFTGTVKPGAQTIRGDYVIAGAGTPPAARKDGSSPWSGMSGAPVFAGRHLIGVVTKDSVGWQHNRLTAVSLVKLAESSGFSRFYRACFGAPVRFTTLRLTPINSAEFDHRYRDYIAETYGELNIFGLDFDRSEHAQWPLESAYLSLELVTEAGWNHSEGGGGRVTDERARVESALYDRERVLLRGPAGSGKTTLVQWLAVNAARDSFGDRLTHLRGRVPVVLQMRTLVRGTALPAVADFLSAAGHPLTPPDGWMDSVLSQGRGLLLIDGVDETAEADRVRTRDWLFKLLAAYPDNVVVVTTRPTAVDDGWLSRREFTEFHLLPMNQRDVTDFIHRWHKAARSISPTTTEQVDLDSLREQLLSTLPRQRDLARLATNPLMCAMICALHRDRHGFLPDSRMKLYGAALTMLLVRRDHERDVGAPEGLVISEDAQQKLLQEIAYWMIRNSLVEAEKRHVIERIGRLLPAMPQVAPPEQADLVFRFLLRRSGVLRTPTPQTVDFIHRTFLDYLGARAAVEAQDLNLVAAHAHEPQWEDIVRMAVGHARDTERAELLTRLVQLGDDQPETAHDVRARIHLLAAASLDHATTLDPPVRAEVEKRAAALVPPKNSREAERLAGAGPIVLDLLPGPEGLTDEEAVAVVNAAQRIGGDHALQVLRGYTGHPSIAVRRMLVDSWRSFDATAFAQLVLAETRTDDVRVEVQRPEELAALPAIGFAREVAFSGALNLDGISSAIQAVRARVVTIRDHPRLKNLTFLVQPASTMTSLTLLSCARVNDYTALADLGLEALQLGYMPHSPTLAALGYLTTLRRLTLLVNEAPYALGALPLADGLRELTLGGDSPAIHVSAKELRRLGALPELRRLSFSAAFDIFETPAVSPLTSVTHLHLHTSIDDDTSTAGLRTVFPRLRELILEVSADRPVTLDVASLAGIPLTRLLTEAGAPVRFEGEHLLFRPTPISPEEDQS